MDGTASVVVRPATRADLPFIGDLVPRLVSFGPLTTRDADAVVASSERTLVDAVERAVAAAPGVAVLVAEDGRGQALGCVQVQQGSEYFSGTPEAYVAVLVVAEGAEGRGVGRALMAAAEGWARERGLDRLALEVFAGNGRARDFYRQQGFVDDSLRVVKRL